MCNCGSIPPPPPQLTRPGNVLLHIYVHVCVYTYIVMVLIA